MFDDEFFDKWLHGQSQRVMQKVADGKGLQHDEIMILLLKAQTNHFAHLDQDLRNEMIALRTDMDKRFEQMEKRFEQVDKRFEQTQDELRKIYQAINGQTWKMIGAIGLIIVLGRLAGGLRWLAG